MSLRVTSQPAADETRRAMLATNVQQRAYYDSRFEAKYQGHPRHERAANVATNIWTRLRFRVEKMRRLAGVEEALDDLHREWLTDRLADARVLDLGCFDGNPLSLWIAERCREYVGIDLCEPAIDALRAKLEERGVTNASLYAQDFLETTWSDRSFDVVYAYSVLHHFADLEVALAEVRRILKPGGIVVTMDPMMTDPLNRFARAIYRPLQTDREWEWPFTRRSFRLLREYFDVVDLQGLQGMAKLGYPLSMFGPTARLARAASRWGLRFDARNARRFGIPFYLCWHATLLLRKRS